MKPIAAAPWVWPRSSVRNSAIQSDAEPSSSVPQRVMTPMRTTRLVSSRARTPVGAATCSSRIGTSSASRSSTYSRATTTSVSPTATTAATAKCTTSGIPARAASAPAAAPTVAPTLQHAW